MLRKILSTTALVAVISTGSAYAQDMDMNTGESPVFSEVKAPAADAKSFFGATDQQVLATSLLGWPVYGHDGDDQAREQVGDINDIVMGSDGKATAAVIGVGGFLGVGEKNVAVSFDRLGWMKSEDGNWLVINATSEELENAPDFEYDDPNLIKGGTAAIKKEADQLQTAAGNAANTIGDETQDLANTTGNAMNNAGDSANKAMDDMVAKTKEMGNDVEQHMNADTTMLEGMSEVSMDSVSFDKLEDAPVLSADGERVGEVSDIITDGGKSQHVLIVDIGGFLGIGEKPVAISAESTTIMSDGDDYVVKTGFSEDALENHPEFSKEAWSKDPDSVLMK